MLNLRVVKFVNISQKIWADNKYDVQSNETRFTQERLQWKNSRSMRQEGKVKAKM